MKYFLLFSTFFFTFFISKAQDIYTVKTVPNPKIDNNTFVSDPAHVLQDATVQQINQLLSVLENQTTDQIAVVVLPSIGDVVPKDFATDLFKEFGIGQKGKDNGLLILMVMDQRRVEFETGYGLEAQLPDMICQRIQQQYMVPRFKENNYDQGLLDGVEATLKILSSPEFAKEFASTANENTETDDAYGIASLVLACIYGIIMFIVFFVKKSQGTFTESYAKLDVEKQKLVKLTIPLTTWLVVYVVIPFLSLYCIYQFGTSDFILLLIVAIYVIILVALLERKSRSTQVFKTSFVEGDYYAQYNSELKYFGGWGVAAFFFPLPFLFTFLANKKQLAFLRKHARNCKLCSSPMVLQDEQADDQFLQSNQVLEEQIKSVDYDVWVCNGCHTYLSLAYVNKGSKYSECSSCHTRAYYMKSDVTLSAATYDHEGDGVKTYDCQHCHKTHEESYSIPRLTRSSDSGGGSSGSSGGSFGGGSSGGGGSGSSW